MRLKDKVAIITGGSQGIGAAICEAYAEEGAIVIVVNKHHPDIGKVVAEKICEKGGRAEASICDVTNSIAINKLVDYVLQKYGRIDILVNNVGIGIFKNFEEHTLEDWDFLINTNLKSAFLFAQAVVPNMKQQSYGKIIFVSSTAANMGYASLTGYSATKGGMQALVKTMVSELAQYNINVNLLSPGSTDTPGNSTFVNDPAVVKHLQQLTPTRTAFIDPKDIAGPAVFLASDEAKAVHGLNLIVDNGITSVVV